jgi:hypothetical protein
MRHPARETTTSCWPEGSRLILRKERPHPGAQLTLTDVDGRRSTVFLTGTGRDVIPGQAAGLEPRHRGCRRKVEGRLIVAALHNGLIRDRPDGTTRTCRNV